MTRLMWLPDVLRSAGLTVHEQGGWKTRGSETFNPRGIIIHETRGSLKSTDAGEINVLLNGSNTAPPPIAQLYLSRSGEWWVIASGKCNHVLTGWAGPFKGFGNSYLLGIEAQHSLNEPWSDTQYLSYVRGVDAIQRHTGWGIAGHKEHQPGGYSGHTSIKTDPGFDMNTFRQDVKDGVDMELTGQSLKMLTAINERLFGLTSLSPTVDSTWSNTPGTEQIHASQALIALRDRAAVDVNALAAAIVALLPDTTLTTDNVRQAVADVLRNGADSVIPV